MGSINYYSTIKFVDAVVGNSSSGLLEVPSLKKITLNIGIRQKDRLKALSVIDLPAKKNRIYTSLKNNLQEKKLTKKYLKTLMEMAKHQLRLLILLRSFLKLKKV